MLDGLDLSLAYIARLGPAHIIKGLIGLFVGSTNQVRPGPNPYVWTWISGPIGLTHVVGPSPTQT